jgi:Flp pilus assembly secretin CpaC
MAMTAPFRKFFAAVLLLLATVPAASAQERAVFLSLGTASRLALDSAFESVIVGDPLIVDVHTGDNRSVVIEPLHPGATNLVFVDTRGLVVANIRILVCASFRSAPASPPDSVKCGQQARSASMALVARADEAADERPF